MLKISGVERWRKLPRIYTSRAPVLRCRTLLHSFTCGVAIKIYPEVVAYRSEFRDIQEVHSSSLTHNTATATAIGVALYRTVKRIAASAEVSHDGALVMFNVVFFIRLIRIDIALAAVCTENAIFCAAAFVTKFSGGTSIIADAACDPVRI